MFNEERIARYADIDEFPEFTTDYQESMRKLWVYETYIRYDGDGDGLAEWRQVFCAGSNYEILKNADGTLADVEVNEHPIDTLTPIRMPHRVFGRSLYDLTGDIQLIKTTVQRQLLDNMYFINNQRVAVNENVNLDDLLTNRPGGAVRTTGTTPPANNISPMPVQNLGNYAMPLLEYIDSVQAARTGISKYSQGLDAKNLNDTASGMNMILGRAQQRTMLIARLFAETGFKRIMQRILKLLIEHQDKPRVIRLRNKWVEMDPRSWNADMDVTVQVGIGQGTAQNKQATLMNIIGLQKAAIDYQGGVDGPLVDLPKIHNAYDQLVKASGYRNADMFFLDPSTPEMQQLYQQMKQNKPPPLEIQKAQLVEQTNMQKAQLSHQENLARLEHDVQRARNDLEFKYKQHADEMAIRDAELRLQEAELELKAATEGHKTDIERKAKLGMLNQKLLEKNPEGLSTSLMDAAEKLGQLVGPMTQAAGRLTGGKTFIHDEKGNVVAVRHEDGTEQQVMRDTNGNMTGLGSIQ